jgi:intergrase/recombinase
MGVVPSRSYRLNVRSYLISIEDLAKTMSILRSSHELYYLVCKLMLEGDLRFSHTTYLVENYKPEEIMGIDGL